MTLRMAGVYDLRTIKMLQEKKVNHFAFDFRPTSLNFIQEHLCLKILKSCSFDHVFLQFDNEKDFVIKRIYELVRASFGGKITLEFFKVPPEIDSLNLPFVYHLDCLEIPEAILRSSRLVGFSLCSKFLNNLKESGNFESWLNYFYTANSGASHKNIHILSRDWDDDLFPSLFDLFDFDLVSLSINNKVESCFRNVDLHKLDKHLSFVR